MSQQANRIAFVCPRLADGNLVGGAETLLRNLAERAAAAGRQVTFLTTCATNHFTWANELPPGERTVGALQVRYFPVDADRDIETFLRVQNRICNGARVTPAEEHAWLANNVNSHALCEHLRAEGHTYDAIVMGPYLFGLIFFAAQVHPDRTVLVPCLHDEAFAQLRAFRDCFHRVRGFLFNTDPERELAYRLYDLKQPPVDAVVGMGLDAFDADPTTFAKRHGITAPYLLYCGRREPLKGTPLLIDYLDVLRDRTGRDIRLVLTGSGEVSIPGNLAPYVLDAGFVSEAEKHEAMAGALAFVHPSVNESLGIVLLEAWLAGTTGLVHARGEVLRWQCEQSGGGLWFRSYPEFEAAVCRLADDPTLRQALGQAGKAYVKRAYAWSAVEQRMLEALDRVPAAP